MTAHASAAAARAAARVQMRGAVCTRELQQAGAECAAAAAAVGRGVATGQGPHDTDCSVFSVSLCLCQSLVSRSPPLQCTAHTERGTTQHNSMVSALAEQYRAEVAGIPIPITI